MTFLHGQANCHIFSNELLKLLSSNSNYFYDYSIFPNLSEDSQVDEENKTLKIFGFCKLEKKKSNSNQLSLNLPSHKMKSQDTIRLHL